MGRNIHRSVRKALARKSLILENHMNGFAKSLEEAYLERILNPLRELLAAYKVSDSATVQEKIKYFENLLTTENLPDSVVSSESNQQNS